MDPEKPIILSRSGPEIITKGEKQVVFGQWSTAEMTNSFGHRGLVDAVAIVRALSGEFLCLPISRVVIHSKYM